MENANKIIEQLKADGNNLRNQNIRFEKSEGILKKYLVQLEERNNSLKRYNQTLISLNIHLQTIQTEYKVGNEPSDPIPSFIKVKFL